MPDDARRVVTLGLYLETRTEVANPMKSVVTDRLLLLSALIVLAGCAANSPGNPGLASTATAAAEQLDLSGVVLVQRGGRSAYEQAFNVGELGGDFEIRADSAFMIASLTKTFTAALVLDQVSQGRISLDASIASYLPQFDAAFADDVQVRHLLQNRSGLPHYTEIPEWFNPAVKSQWSPATFLAELEALQLKFPPGDRYLYSNVNYYLLGMILEAATGTTYEALLQERLLAPLRLNSAGQLYATEPSQVAPTYIRTGNGYERIRIGNAWLFRATASQVATAQDLAAFGRALVRGEVLEPTMLALMLDPDRAMGVTVMDVQLAGEASQAITYNGELAGTTTMLTVFPEQDLTVVILSNNNLPYRAMAGLTTTLAEATLQ